MGQGERRKDRFGGITVGIKGKLWGTEVRKEEAGMPRDMNDSPGVLHKPV